MSALLVVVVALPFVAALLCAVSAGRLGDRAGRLGAAASAGSLALAVPLAGRIVAVGPVAATLGAGAGHTGVGFVADRLSVVMLLLVLGVSTIVQLFSSRYLSADPRQAPLVALLSATTAAVCALVCAATLSGLVVAWLASGLGLLGLLGLRRDLPAGRASVRRTAATFVISDGALVLAAALVWGSFGDIGLRGLPQIASRLAAQHLIGGLNTGAVVACLIVVAAMGRSAQLPFQRWLPATVAAPTPVSAFLHAGLVNAGGFLLVRLHALFGLTAVAADLAFTVGAATALYGTVLMLARPDVKGGLAHSTMGQMGFMMMACGLGVPAAAIFHLVGHGLYKASLFLGADSVVHNDKRRAHVPAPAPAGVRWPRAVRVLLAGAAPAAGLTAAFATFAGQALQQHGSFALLAFVWATATAATIGWLERTPGRAASGLVAVAVACAGYAGLLAGAHALLDGTLVGPAAAAGAASPWLVAIPVAAGLVAAVFAARSASARAWLYVRALDAGYVSTARSVAAPRRVHPSRPAMIPVLDLRSA
jgi:NADH-quinone oxidoreductase subunit L/NAD(P)H-quinone oxidoreductase subunit 5